jgi:hypothetical protein
VSFIFIFRISRCPFPYLWHSFYNDVNICVTSYFIYEVSHEGKSCTKFQNQHNWICSKFYALYINITLIYHIIKQRICEIISIVKMQTICKENLGVAPWRRTFSRLNVLIICYGTAVEHRSLLNRSGICNGTNCCNIFIVHRAVLSIKTAFNLGKIHLLFRVMPLIQWSVMFCRPCFYHFWGTEIYIPRLFSEYMLTFRVEEPMTICVLNEIRNILIIECIFL